MRLSYYFLLCVWLSNIYYCYQLRVGCRKVSFRRNKNQRERERGIGVRWGGEDIVKWTMNAVSLSIFCHPRDTNNPLKEADKIFNYFFTIYSKSTLLFAGLPRGINSNNNTKSTNNTIIIYNRISYGLNGT